jgi:hypothetical protein
MSIHDLTPAQVEAVKNGLMIAFMLGLFAIACIALWIDKDITKGPK